MNEFDTSGLCQCYACRKFFDESQIGVEHDEQLVYMNGKDHVRYINLDTCPYCGSADIKKRIDYDELEEDEIEWLKRNYFL